MSPETAIDPPWRTVFSAEYVKTHLALVALDEARIVDWLVLHYTTLTIIE